MSDNDNSEGETLSKFKAGLSRIKAGAQRVGHEAKEQVSNPESATRKVASGVKQTGKAITGEVSKASKNEYVQRVGNNSVKLVRGEDEGLLGVHREQKERSKNSHMDNMFTGMGTGFTIMGSGGKQKGPSFGGSFSIMGEGGSNRQRSARHRNRGRGNTKTVIVTRTEYQSRGRRREKRKQRQSDWNLF